jgi:hypothetical protein
LNESKSQLSLIKKTKESNAITIKNYETINLDGEDRKGTILLKSAHKNCSKFVSLLQIKS